MPYRSAILSAIEDLKDHQTGSPLSSIKRHIQTHKNHIDPLDDDDDPTWNETLFQSTIKSLVEQGEIVHVNGTNYKFSDTHLKKRAELLKARAEARMEQQSLLNRHHHTTNVISGGCKSSAVATGGGRVVATGMAGATSGSVANHVGHGQCQFHMREEPPKEIPAKKTVHAKVKIGDSKIITVVNPDAGKQHGKKHDDEEMDTENEEDAIEIDGKGHKKHVKIIPRKVDGKKKMISDSMAT